MPYLAAISPHRGHLLFHHLSHVVAKTGPHLQRSCFEQMSRDFEFKNTLGIRHPQINQDILTYLVISCPNLSLSPVHLVGS